MRSSFQCVARLAAVKSCDTSCACGSIEPPTSIIRITRVLGRRGGRVTISSSPAFLAVASMVAVDVELAVAALAREGAQLAQRDLDLAHVEHQVAAVGPVPARVGRFAWRRLRPPPGAPTWMPHRVLAAAAERRGAAGARSSGCRRRGARFCSAEALLEPPQHLLEVERLDAARAPRWREGRASAWDP